MRYKGRKLLTILCSLTPLLLGAQTEGHYHTDMVGIGSAYLLDTYLSQEKYSGTEVRFLSQTHHPWEKHPSWHHQTTLMGAFLLASQRAENSDELGGTITFDYTVRHTWQLSDAWQIAVGGQAEAGVGFLYNTRNANNPAQARAYLHIGPNVMTAWRFPLFHRNFSLRYEAAAPLIGAMFTPNYGQSYYEIFTRGNYDHNVVVTTPASAPTLRQQLTLDFPLGKNVFRVGYLGDYQQAKVNSLKYHTYSHLLLIGWVRPLYRR